MDDGRRAWGERDHDRRVLLRLDRNGQTGDQLKTNVLVCEFVLGLHHLYQSLGPSSLVKR